MLSAVEPAAGALEEALRRAVFTLDSDTPESPGSATNASPANPTSRSAADAGTL